MKCFIRIISFILVFVICLGSISFVYAAESGDFVSSYDFWGWLADHTQAFWDLFGLPNFFSSASDSCDVSDDHLHHASTGTPYRTSGSLSGGNMVFWCFCDYCGDPFDATMPYEDYLAKAKSAYDDFTGNTPTTGGESGGTFGGRRLPVTRIGSDGALYWTPFWTDCSIAGHTFVSDPDPSYSFGSYIPDDGNGSAVFNYHCNSGNFYDSSRTNFYVHLDSSYPISGIYSSISSSLISSYTYFDQYGRGPFYGSSKPFSLSSSLLVGSHNAGDDFSVRYCPPGQTQYCDWSAFVLSVQNPVIKIIPFESISSDPLYNIDGRATSFTGDLGIMGDNGTLTKVEGDQIFNETTNYYHNPVTNNTTNITDWTYDYSDRSYHLTTEEGDTITVTYGDENITIQEGDQTYNVYYVIVNESGGSQGGGGEGTDPTHTHSWGEPTDSTPPTCTAPGSKTYTCSECGETKTETVPATGHKWVVKENVPTKYDEDGQLVQEGYTIYECSVCGEQYKSTDGTGPPGGGGSPGSGSGGGTEDDDGDSIWDKLGHLLGSLGSSLLELIGAVVGKLLDGLISLADMIAEKLLDVVNLVLSWFDEIPKLFSGFLGFLTAIFPFLPPDIMLLLTFGIAAIVFIGIIKAVRR